MKKASKQAVPLICILSLFLIFLSYAILVWLLPAYRNQQTAAAISSGKVGSGDAMISELEAKEGALRFFRFNQEYLGGTGNGLDESGWYVDGTFRPVGDDQGQLTIATVGSPSGIWKSSDGDGNLLLRAEWDADSSAFLNLCIWQEPPEESAPCYIPYSDPSVTRTEYLGTKVIGSGMPDGVKLLYFTLPDGSFCQLLAQPETNCDTMVMVLDHLMQNGIDLTCFFNGS